MRTILKSYWKKKKMDPISINYMAFTYYEKYHLHEFVDRMRKLMKTATLINEIISIRTLYANIKESFKKKKCNHII